MRRVILCVAAVLSFALLYETGRFYIAWQMGRSRNVSTQVRGAALVGNADAWDRLGEATAANFDNSQPQQATLYFQKAVKLNPHSASSWTDLAEAYEEEGNIAEARYAYGRAQEDYPISADVRWKFGNFLLRQGQTSEGLEEIHQSLLTDPKLVPLAISRVWAVEPHVELLLRNVLPDDRESYFEAIDFFVSRHDGKSALQTWEQIRSTWKANRLQLPLVFPLLNELISSDQADDAQRVWREALDAAHWSESESSDDSGVWNGGFEEPITDGGLGWRLIQEDGAYISIDSQESHSGSRSLRVDFTGGANLDFSGAQQFIPVAPKTNYKFQCFIRTRSISTESGIRFEILDPNHGSVNVDTPALTETNPWTLVTADMTTGPDTHFLEIRLRRFPSRLFDNKISGTVWVDDVSLKPAPASETESRP